MSIKNTARICHKAFTSGVFYFQQIRTIGCFLFYRNSVNETTKRICNILAEYELLLLLRNNMKIRYVSKNSILVAFSYEKMGVTVQKDALISFLTSKMMGV